VLCRLQYGNKIMAFYYKLCCSFSDRFLINKRMIKKKYTEFKKCIRVLLVVMKVVIIYIYIYIYIYIMDCNFLRLLLWVRQVSKSDEYILYRFDKMTVVFLRYVQFVGTHARTLILYSLCLRSMCNVLRLFLLARNIQNAKNACGNCVIRYRTHRSVYFLLLKWIWINTV
jgi:hypothetical protein